MEGVEGAMILLDTDYLIGAIVAWSPESKKILGG